MTKNKLTKLINNCQNDNAQETRDYIGASSIGSDCLRQIWYQFKGVIAESVPAKFIRTWEIGKKLESLVVEWLVNAGVRVDTTGFSYHAFEMPYFKGHFDGIILERNKRYILEIKTAKDASFNIFVKKGLKAWNPQYYAQVQAYMGMGSIPKAYILVLNKDNSELSDELITFDAEFYQKLCEKARLIYSAHIEPPRINGSPLFYKCKMCKFNKVCHK